MQSFRAGLEFKISAPLTPEKVLLALYRQERAARGGSRPDGEQVQEAVCGRQAQAVQRKGQDALK